MPAGYLAPTPRFHADDDDGNPLAAGKLYAYAAGGLTPLPTYADQPLTVPNANPIILDARGEAVVYIPDGVAYRFILKDADGVTIWDQDDVEIPSTSAPPAASNGVQTGTVLPFAGAALPAGYLLCDGSAVSRAVYAALFAVIGVVYGSGDGSTTFNVPDMRGKFPLGKAAAGTGSTLGGSGGTLDHTHSIATHSHTTDTVADHTHTVPHTGWGSTSGTPDASGQLTAYNSGGPITLAANGVTSGAAGGHSHTVSTGGTTVTGTNNPPFLSLNFMVKI